MGAAVQSYTLEEIEAGLIELAIWHGNAKQAARTLAERGLEIPRTTLQTWKQSHADRLAQLEEQIVPQVREKLAAQYEVIGMRAAELTLDSMDRLGKELGDIPARDLAGAVRNLSTTGAIGIDKASLLRGMPTEIHGKPDSWEETIKRLQEAHPNMFVESTAEEIHEADVVEEKQSKAQGHQLSRQSSSPNAHT